MLADFSTYGKKMEWLWHPKHLLCVVHFPSLTSLQPVYKIIDLNVNWMYMKYRLKNHLGISTGNTTYGVLTRKTAVYVCIAAIF